MTCKPGYGLNVECGNIKAVFLNEIRCVECIANETYSSDNSVLQCKPCRKQCGYNERELATCSPNQNRLCKCKYGFYPHPTTGNCTEECCYCTPEDTVIKDCEMLKDGRVSLNFVINFP